MLLRFLKSFFFLSLIFSFIISKTYSDPSENNEKKIALLFLTRGDLNHPNIWKTLLEKSENKEKFNIYIHSKEPMTDSYFKDFRIPIIVPTTWSQHVFAWHALIKEALHDPSNYKFVFLSESCVPLQRLDIIYKNLIADDKTYMGFGRPWWSHPDRDILKLPEKYRWGNGEWVILNRRHTEILFQDRKIIHIISKHDSDQESWPSSALNFYKVLDEVENRSTTYMNWRIPAEKNHLPREFFNASAFNISLIRNAKKNGFLFGRKFMKSFPEAVLLDLINN
jgi:hypothetical protein